MLKLLCLVFPGLMFLTLQSCTLTPEVTELPTEASATDEIGAPESRPFVEVEPATLDNGDDGKSEAATWPVEKLEMRGVRGGQITLDLDGAPEEILALLLDFDHAAGRRAWARTYAVKSRTDNRVLTRWEFDGKAGINPSCDLVFDVIRRTTDIVLRFKLATTDFGLQAFFGDFRLVSSTQSATRTRVVQRVFIDSGVFLANATDDDIAAGLREDMRLIRLWLAERRGD